MQATYHIKNADLNDSFLKVVQEHFRHDQELTITVKSNEQHSSDNEKSFFELFGSWEGDETGDELSARIYADRVNSSKEIDL